MPFALQFKTIDANIKPTELALPPTSTYSIQNSRHSTESININVCYTTLTRLNFGIPVRMMFVSSSGSYRSVSTVLRLVSCLFTTLLERDVYFVGRKLICNINYDSGTGNQQRLEVSVTKKQDFDYNNNTE